MKRLNTLQKSKLKEFYRDNWLYRLIMVPAKEIEQKLSRVRLSPEEVFLECLTQLDKALDNPEAFKIEARMIWDDYYCEFRDNSPSDSPESELGMAATEICFVISFILYSIESSLTIKTIMPKIMKRMIEHQDVYDKIERCYNKTLQFPETNLCIKELQSYVADGKQLSHTILEQIKEWSEDPLKSEKIEVSDSGDDTYTIQQLVILFQELFNTSLSAQDINITEFARFIHKVTGKNLSSIRTTINRLNASIKTPYKDIKLIAEDIKRFDMTQAKEILNRYD